MDNPTGSPAASPVRQFAIRTDLVGIPGINIRGIAVDLVDSTAAEFIGRVFIFGTANGTDLVAIRFTTVRADAVSLGNGQRDDALNGIHHRRFFVSLTDFTPTRTVGGRFHRWRLRCSRSHGHC